MKDDQAITPLGKRAFAGRRRNGRLRLPPDEVVADSLRRAYAATLAEPLPPALLDLLQRLA